MITIIPAGYEDIITAKLMPVIKNWGTQMYGIYMRPEIRTFLIPLLGPCKRPDGYDLLDCKGERMHAVLDWIRNQINLNKVIDSYPIEPVMDEKLVETMSIRIVVPVDNYPIEPAMDEEIVETMSIRIVVPIEPTPERKTPKFRKIATEDWGTDIDSSTIKRNYLYKAINWVERKIILVKDICITYLYYSGMILVGTSPNDADYATRCYKHN